MAWITTLLNKNKALQYRHFRFFLLMRLSVIMAFNMQAAIISYFVYKLTHDKLALGMIGLSEVIPAIGFSLFSGHFVDQMEKKAVIARSIVLYLLQSAFFIMLALPWMRGYATVSTITWLVYGGVFVGGAIRAFISPSTFALLSMLVPRDQYPNATTWSSAAWQTGAVVGPLIGGFLIAAYGFAASLVGVAALQLGALLVLSRIPAQRIPEKVNEPVMKRLAEGLRFVFRTQVILGALSLDMFAVLFGGAVALLPVYSDDILGVGEIGYGWLRAAPGIGSVAALMILAAMPLRKKPGVKLHWSVAGFGVTTIIFGYCGYFGTAPVLTVGGFGISAGFIVAFLMLLLGGMLDSVSVVIRGTALQLYTPDEMRGRVAAVNTMFISSSNELGAMESGITARLMGTVPAVVFGGCMTILVVLITWFKAPKLRNVSFHEDGQ